MMPAPSGGGHRFAAGAAAAMIGRTHLPLRPEVESLCDEKGVFVALGGVEDIMWSVRRRMYVGRILPP